MKSKNEIVLVVDDEPRNVRIIQKSLKTKYRLSTAKDGNEALEFLKKQVPAIILLDIMMPGPNGYEVCKKIREDERLKMTKVILVSGKAMVEERMQGYEAGADDYITKPFVREELEAKVNVFMKLYLAEKKLKSINESLEEEVKQRTLELLKSEKMAFIGRHAAEIVHNLKNPISGIVGQIYFLKKKDKENPRFEKIENSIKKINEIASTILDTTRNTGDDDSDSVDINSVIKEEVEILELDSFFRKEVKIALSLEENLPHVEGRKIHFGQIISNILTNAKDALYNSDIKEVSVSSKLQGSNVEVVVKDSGHGISRENLSLVFQSLFTTKKPQGQGGRGVVGTGLGLAFCKKMIESYGGSISLSSEVAKGTEFIISIPVKVALMNEAS